MADWTVQCGFCKARESLPDLEQPLKAHEALKRRRRWLIRIGWTAATKGRELFPSYRCDKCTEEDK